MRFREIQQKFWRENTRTMQISSMIKCKKVLSWDDNTTKEQSKVSSSIKKGLSWVDKTTRTIKLSSNIKKFFPGLIRPQKSWHSRLFRMLTLWWEEHPRPINQSITIISDITQLWKESSGQTNENILSRRQRDRDTQRRFSKNLSLFWCSTLKTLPKAQRTRGLSSYHKLHTNLDQTSISEPR